MKTLQAKAFWRRKRAVLENQLFHVENRIEIGRHRLGSGASPVVVSELDNTYRAQDPARLEIYRTRF